MPVPRPIDRLTASGVALVLVATVLLALRPDPAAGVVTPLLGYRATVDGFTSWYGSYGMGGLGTTWCIDHGIRAPDPAYAYRVADLSAVPIGTRTAMAWILGRGAVGTDRARHAAVMLALHDLMGAVYPSGPLDLDQLTPAQLVGFAGHETAVLELARRLKADGLRHAHLRGPLTMRVRVGERDGAGAVPILVSVVDGRGQPVAGLLVSLEVSAGSRLSNRVATTTADGTIHTSVRPVRLPLTVRANALAPSLDLDAWAPTVRAAQRVARPSMRALDASASVAAPPATTTSTTAPPSTTTTTTIPPTTTTTTALTTTTTRLAPTSTEAQPVGSSTSTSAWPPETVLSAPPVVPALPRTGVDALGLVLLASGLLLLGLAALDLGRQRTNGRSQ